jgi:hypothetical protein
MPRNKNSRAPKKVVSKKSVETKVAPKSVSVSTRTRTKNTLQLSPNVRKNLPILIVAAIIVLAGIYVMLPGRDHFLGDVKKATVQNGVTYRGIDGQNALTLLKADHNVGETSYGKLGSFVTSIDDVKADKNHYWAFYVNGKASQVGASNYTTKNSDTLNWKLEAIN